MSVSNNTARDLTETCVAELRHPGTHFHPRSSGEMRVHALHIAPRPLPTRPALSDREREVLLAWFRSDSKIEAARTLFIAIGTMNTHITRIRTKYSAAGRPAATKAALFARALQDEIIHLDDW